MRERRLSLTKIEEHKIMTEDSLLDVNKFTIVRRGIFRNNRFTNSWNKRNEARNEMRPKYKTEMKNLMKKASCLEP